VAVVTVRRRSWLAVGLFVLRCAGADAQSGAPTEAQVKAVFLYNFTKYVAWPTEAFRSAADPLNVCILGADAFGPVLDETLQGERVQDRKLVSRRIATVDEVDGCHLLFLSASEERQLPRILKALEAKAAGRAPRYGPTSFPDIPWPNPLEVAPPWEGGDGKSKN